MQEKIRNFCIIAHIDHGKSTLADRFLEITETVKKFEHGQVLDKLDLEQERGITIKLTPVRMQRKGFELNLIDTPGHVDFQYEVSRSLAAVEGAILLVDATQGVQAQTLSTLYMAIEYNLTIIPVINKIDLPAAQPEKVADQLQNLLGIDKSEIIAVSAKTGKNVDKVLDLIIEKIPQPNSAKFFPTKDFPQKNLLQDKDFFRALIFDSVYDNYRGVVSYIKVISGEIKAGKELILANTGKKISISQVGYFDPNYHKDKKLSNGQIGYIVTGEKSVREVKIGDTLLKSTQVKDFSGSIAVLKNFSIPGFKTLKPFVYAGVYPLETHEFEKLKQSLEKLSLNDSAIEFEFENSQAFGFGFRCGFLGLLHMEIVKQRLEREFDIQTVFTMPTVVYLAKVKNRKLDIVKTGKNVKLLKEKNLEKYIPKGEKIQDRIPITGSGEIGGMGDIEEIREPFAEIEIIGPKEYTGNIMQLCQDFRGELKHMEEIDETRLLRTYQMPLGEIIVNFYDKLKSISKGYASMNYTFSGYRKSQLLKLDVFVNNQPIEALSRFVHKQKSYYFARDLAARLKELIPRHLFPIPIQVGIGKKILAREDIPALKKNVLAKCYGGDISRKRKLLQKQKEGKKKMKALGKVNVPADLFLKIFSQN